MNAGPGERARCSIEITMHDKRGRFEAVVLPHLDAAYRFARWLSQSPTDAEDVVQDAVLRAYRGFDGLRSGDVKAWLLAIVRNCHSTALRKQRRGISVPLPEEHDSQDGHAMIATDPGPEAVSISAEHARTLDQVMSTLAEEHREVLVLREIEGMDYREIAAITNVPIGTVMSRLARARASLKSRWMTSVEGTARAVP